MLHSLSEQLASHLVHILASLPPPGQHGRIIPVLLPQSLDLYVAWLAILKAGAAVCPLNVDTPSERLNFIVGDVDARVVVTNEELTSVFQNIETSITVVKMEESKTFAPGCLSGVDICNEDLAYIMYTSGSTGLPKGVGISHQAAVQALLAHDELIPRFRRFLQFAAPTFDVSVFEIFFPLFRGVTLVGCNRRLMLNDLPGIINQLNVDAAELTPTVCGELLQSRDAVPCLKLLLTIGEMLTRHVVDEFGSSEDRPGLLHGMYGPTEATIHCTAVSSVRAGSLVGNIGTPFKTVSAFIISMDHIVGQEPVILPVGHVGELVVGGPQLARYYLNRPTENRNAFIDSKTYGRLYRTGDKARLHPNGELQCMGRISTGQVKLRGQRIELGEIENVLLKNQYVRNAAACVIQGVLVAFLSADVAHCTSRDLQFTCRRSLPKFMIPGNFVILNKLPRLPSGKIDRKGLEAEYILSKGVDQTDLAEPAGDIEQKISVSLNSILESSITPTASLASAGLDSLRAIHLASSLRKEGVFLNALDILEADSIRKMAAFVLKSQPEMTMIPTETIDPSAPIARKQFILEDSKADILMCGMEQQGELKNLTGIRLVVVNEEGLLEGVSSSPPTLNFPIHGDATCYCLYTSGSTGTPKGCEITHDNAVQAMLSFQRLFAGHWEESSRWFQFASFHFDVSVLEQYWTWSVGICLTSCPRDTLFEDFAGTLRDLSITHIDLTPSLAQLIHPEDVPTLCRGVFITGGEKLKQEILEHWGPHEVIYNGYGPTEVTIGCTMLPRVTSSDKPTNIGPQFDNVSGYVFKQGTNTPVLRGGIGELCVSGPLVGKGYLNRPQLTAEKFQYIETYGERVYRTGDLVRMMHDGSFCFLGRIDDQVKLRGQRLEINEINHVIKNSTEEVGDVVTMVLKHPTATKEQIVSFTTVVTSASTAACPEVDYSPEVGRVLEAIRSECRLHLPGYMIPTHIIPLTRFPLSSNNKIDNGQLRGIFASMLLSEMQALSSHEQESPTEDTDTIRTIIPILSKFTKLEEKTISSSSNIFELGLDSILVISFSRALREAGFPAAHPSVVMKCSTLSILAKAIESPDNNGEGERRQYEHAKQKIAAFAHMHMSHLANELEVAPQDIEAITPCTSLQDGMLYQCLRNESHPYLTSFKFQLAPDTEVPMLREAWKRAQVSFQLLRTKFPLTDDGYALVVLKEAPLPWFECATSKDDELESTAESRFKEWNLSFNNFMNRVWEIGIISSPKRRWMCLNIFHGLYDGISLPVILDTVKNVYNSGQLPRSMPFTEVLPLGPLRESLWEPVASFAEADYPLALEVQSQGNGSFQVTAACQGDILTSDGISDLLEQFRLSVRILVEEPFANLGFSGNSASTEASTKQITNKVIGDPSPNGIASFQWSQAASLLRQEIAKLANLDVSDIDEDSSILEVGLDSIDAIKLSSRLKRDHLDLSVGNIMRNRTIRTMMAEVTVNDSATKANLTYLKSLEAQLRRSLEEDGKDLGDIEHIYPATPLQEGMINEMLSSDGLHYFNHDILQISEDVDVNMLKNAWETTANRHSILRTSFAMVSDPNLPFSYAQLIHKSSIKIDWNIVDISDNSIESILREERARALSLVMSKPLFNLRLIRDGVKLLLILSLPHAMYDGWSLSLLHQDVVSAYSGQDSTRPSYQHVLEHIISSSREEGLQFWKGVLSDAKPSIFPQQPGAGGQGALVHRDETASDIPLSHVLNFCKAHGVTAQALGLTCWTIVLASYLGQLDVLFGTVMLGRDTEEASKVVFPTMNTVAVRGILHGSVSEMLEYVQRNLGNMLAHQHYPLRKIKSMMGVGNKDLFDTLFIYQKSPSSQEGQDKPLYKSINSSSSVEYSVCVELEAIGDSAVWRVACKDTLLSKKDTNQLVLQLLQVFKAIIQSPETSTADFVEVIEQPTLDTVTRNGASLSDEPSGTAIEPAVWSPLEERIRDTLSLVAAVPKEEITRNTTIFHFGIDSISAIKVSSLLRRQSVLISVRDILRAETVGKMAEIVNSAQKKKPTPATSKEKLLSLQTLRNSNIDLQLGKYGMKREDVEAFLPATAGQVYMLETWKNSHGKLFFPDFFYRVTGRITQSQLDSAWKVVTAKLPILRTTILSIGDTSMPYVLAELKRVSNPIIWRSDLRVKSNRRHVATRQGSGLVYLYASQTETETLLMLHIHHALYDAVMLQHLINTLESLCRDVSTPVNAPVDIAEFIQYGKATSSEAQQEAFWRGYLGNDTTPVAKDASGPVMDVQPGAGKYQPALLDDTDWLNKVCQAEGLSVQAVFLAVYSKIHVREFHVRGADLTVGVYLANRSHDLAGLPELVAPTLNIVPLRIQDPGSRSVFELARIIQSDLHEIGSAENCTVSLAQIAEWTGIRLDTTVNFIKLPEVVAQVSTTTSGAPQLVQVTEEEVLEWQSKESCNSNGSEQVDAAAKSSSSSKLWLEEMLGIESGVGLENAGDVYKVSPLPPGSQLSQDPPEKQEANSKPSPQPSVDIEAAVRNNTLDVGVFGPSSDKALGVLDGVRCELLALQPSSAR
ncbi:hypothetical protein GY631_4966 [Trichophyton interdigitale]|nr:hypothetical protein GY631_4966 [Trichophyton interdigitale]